MPRAQMSTERALHQKTENVNERGFFYRAGGVAGADGWARIRVPYATGSRGDVSTGDTYEIRGLNVRGQVSVTEAAVQSGAILQTRDSPPRKDS